MTRRVDWGWALTVTCITVWAFSVLGLYFVVHKPFDLANVLSLASHSADLVVAGMVVYVGIGLGIRCIPAERDVAPLERLTLAAGAGLGMMGLGVLATGMAGGLYRWLFWGLLVAGVVLFARPVIGLLRQALCDGLEVPGGNLARFLALFVALMLLMALLQALLPPFFWDSVVYHLTGPKLWIEQHRIWPAIDLPFLGYPALMESLFTVGLLLKGPAVAQLLHWSFAGLTLLLLYVFARRYFDTRVAWFSMALLVSVPSIAGETFWAYVDVTLMFFELAAVYVFLRWVESRSAGWLLLSGVFTGLAMGTKYSAITLAIALLLLILSGVRASGLRETTVAVLLFGGTALLVVLPWLLRNWAFTGNPVAPFLFGTTGWEAFRRHFYNRPGSGLAFTEPWRLLTAPWDVTIVPHGSERGFGSEIGPLLLVSVPIVFLVWSYASTKQKRVLASIGAISLIQYGFWLLGVAQSMMLQQVRLLFPVFPLLALLGGYGLGRLQVLRRPAIAVDWIIHAVVVVCLCLTLVEFGLNTVLYHPVANIAGLRTDDEYLEQRLGAYYKAVDFINRELPEDARIYFLWESRSYHCERDCRPDTILDAFKRLTHRLRNAPEIYRYLLEEGYTHVLLYKWGMDYVIREQMDPFDETDMAIFRELEREYMSPLREFEGPQSYILYELHDEPKANGGGDSG